MVYDSIALIVITKCKYSETLYVNRRVTVSFTMLYISSSFG